MLIIPIENKPDWAHPPVITIGLILINLLVFLFYQGNDDDIAERAGNIYSENNLLQFERDYYLDYLRAENPQDVIALEEVGQQEVQDEYLFWSIFYDRDFDYYLSKLWNEELIPNNEANRAWLDIRSKFEQERNKLSSIAAGLTPAESKPWTFVSSIFLHGGWDHLLGNMVFLFLFGFALETVLRPHVYLSMYLVSGIVASGMFTVFNLNSYVPLVGASGAISGLMGMYLALYRLRRIRFFYTVFFYFGEFRAPALFILPLWLAKELYGHFFVDSNTAYWAHIGGLLAGTGLMLMAQKSQQQFGEIQEVKAQDDDVAQALKKIQLAMTELDYNRARSLARGLCRRYPDDLRPWLTLFDLHKIQPSQKAFHEATFAVLKQFISEQSSFQDWQHPMQEMLKEYKSLAPKTPALTGNVSLALARKFWRNGARHQCENFLITAQKRGPNPQAAIQLLKEMQAYYREHRQAAKAQRFATWIEELQQASPPKVAAAD